MGALRTAEGYPGWLIRLAIGALGSAVPLAGPFVVKFVAIEQPITPLTIAAHTAALSVMVFIALAWVLSVFVTVYIEEDHILKIVLGSLGIPAVIVSGAVGLQAVQ